MVKTVETENRAEATEAGRRGEGKLVCSGYRVSELQDEKVLEICCTTV